MRPAGFICGQLSYLWPCRPHLRHCTEVQLSEMWPISPQRRHSTSTGGLRGIVTAFTVVSQLIWCLRAMYGAFYHCSSPSIRLSSPIPLMLSLAIEFSSFVHFRFPTAFTNNCFQFRSFALAFAATRLVRCCCSIACTTLTDDSCSIHLRFVANDSDSSSANCETEKHEYFAYGWGYNVQNSRESPAYHFLSI